MKIETELTPFQLMGYKHNDVFVLKESNIGLYDVGEIVMINYDDRSDCPLFIGSPSPVNGVGYKCIYLHRLEKIGEL